uniref:Uncharacterized protein n=1 Tax=Meloidogyne enterolobii TaxID=390850 RepID=A0A6V7W3Y9_MELEN|nr:unnamed protein product [Meloidogyne enterolobii]
MKKLGIGNDSKKKKKSVKGETSSGCWQISSKSKKKKEKAENLLQQMSAKIFNFQPEGSHTEEFNFQNQTESLYTEAYQTPLYFPGKGKGKGNPPKGK